jgi:hypothetical protein
VFSPYLIHIGIIALSAIHFRIGLLDLPWQAVRDGVEVKLLPQEQVLYTLARSTAAFTKNAACAAGSGSGYGHGSSSFPLMQLGTARAKSPVAWRLIEIEPAQGTGLSFAAQSQEVATPASARGPLPAVHHMRGQSAARFYIQLVDISSVPPPRPTVLAIFPMPRRPRGKSTPRASPNSHNRPCPQSVHTGITCIHLTTAHVETQSPSFCGG